MEKYHSVRDITNQRLKVHHGNISLIDTGAYFEKYDDTIHFEKYQMSK